MRRGWARNRNELLGLLALGVLGLSVLTACDSTDPDPASEHDPDDPLVNFDALWSDVDRSYALFGVHDVDWDSLGAAYRTMLDRDSEVEVVRAVFCDLVAELGDGRTRFAEAELACPVPPPDNLVWFADGDAGRFWIEYQATRRVIAEHYLLDADTSATVSWIVSEQSQDRRFRYLELDSFADDGYVDWDAIDELFAGAPDCDGLVIDIRASAGGDDERVFEVANALAAGPQVFFNVHSRSGPTHDGFSEPRAVEAAPHGMGWGDVPLAILTHAYTSEAAERFLLAMRHRPGVVVVGARTRGMLASPTPRVLPNGWPYLLCDELVRDVQGECWEGQGVPPDYEVWNVVETVFRGRDLVLEVALTLLLLREDVSPAPRSGRR